MEAVLNAPQEEEITCLYSFIATNLDLLQSFDNQPLASTPLHLAAGHGRMHLALEIQLLMPSFARKLDFNGFSPLHLAIQRDQEQTAIALVAHDAKLVCVKGREGFTALHDAASRGNLNLVKKFLGACPDSVRELTLRQQTALHVAVKYGRVEVAMYLIEWLLKRPKSADVLWWRDGEGNTLLHLAVSTNDPQVVEQILRKRCWKLNKMNLSGLTPLGMATNRPEDQVNQRIVQILQPTSFQDSAINLWVLFVFPDLYGRLDKAAVSYRDVWDSWDEMPSESVTTNVLRLNAYINSGLITSEMRNSILVVMALIATASYQAALSPPGGFINQSPITSATSNATSVVAGDGYGYVAMRFQSYKVFTAFNSLALISSLTMISFVLPKSFANSIVLFSVVFLLVSYIVAITATYPHHHI